MPANRPHILFFDVNGTLLNLAEVRESIATAIGGGQQIFSLWFETMLHYSLVSTAIDNYRKFDEIGAAALVVLAKARNVNLTVAEAKDVLKPIQSAPPHPEVPDALKEFRDHGFRMAALTNSSREVMKDQLENADINRYFEQALSVEDMGIYKPHKEVYQRAARKLNVKPEDCLFIAAHGWDVTGAMAAEMRALFVARGGQEPYPFGPEPDIVKPDIAKAARYLID